MPQVKKSYSIYRNLILLSEIGAYLHDLGKLSKLFLLSKAKRMKVKDFHGQVLFIDEKVLPQNVKAFLFVPLFEFLGVREVKGIDLSLSLSHFLCAHHGCSRCLFKGECKFREDIQSHPLIALLRTVDHLDASNPANSGKQEPFTLVRDDIFCGETELPVKELDKMRVAFYEEFEKFLSEKRSITEINKFVKRSSACYFENALSETRKYGNDITLLDHSNAVSSLYKAFLYAYLFYGKKMPNSFFGVRFRLMGVKSGSPHTEEMVSYELACCNKVAKTSAGEFYIVANFKNGGAFAKFIENKTKGSVKFFETNDFSPIFEGKFCGKDLKSVKTFVNSLYIKEPGGISPDYTEKQAVSDIKKAVLFAVLRRKEAIGTALKSSKKHLANLRKGAAYDPANLKKVFAKEKEILRLEKRLKAGISAEKIKRTYNWNSSRDAEKEIYDYFNKVLSPVRPPSPIEMSNYLLKLYNKYRSFKKVYEEFFLKKPLVPGRVCAIFRSLRHCVLQSGEKC